MNLLPKYVDGKLVDGSYIHLEQFCIQKHCVSKKCINHYLQISNKSGFHQCPYGYSSYVNAEQDYIFTGFRKKGSVCKASKARQGIDSNTYNPVLKEEQLLDLIESSYEYDREHDAVMAQRSLLDSISHEARKLNAQIKERCDVLLENKILIRDQLDSNDLAALQAAIMTIFVSASMVDSRFSLLDYEKNPDTLKTSGYIETNVYKKFHKAQRVFKNYKKKNIPIVLHGESYAKIKAYQSFELIPVLLIENAVKYSYEYENQIDIDFEENDHELIVKVKSFGPHCSKEEINKVFKKGFRGKYAKMSSCDGSGLGLSLVKILCDIHNIAISIDTASSTTPINGLPYSNFIVTLTFSNINK